MRRICWIVAACAAPVFGQLDNGSITITASRSVRLQPDQVVFSIVYPSGLTTLDDVLAQLAPLGINANNFQGVSTLGPAGMSWSFLLPVPLANLNGTFAAIQSLQQSLQLNFSISGAQVSPELQAAQQCSMSDLVSDARAQAQKLAALAGMKVGAVLAVAQGNLGGTIPTAVFRLTAVAGIFSGVFDPLAPGTGLSSFLLGLPSTSVQPITCSATVKFALAN